MAHAELVEFNYRCGHCLYAIKRMESVKGINLTCPSCGAGTTYREVALPLVVKLQPGHICHHPIHDEGMPLLRLLLVRNKTKKSPRGTKYVLKSGSSE